MRLSKNAIFHLLSTTHFRGQMNTPPTIDSLEPFSTRFDGSPITFLHLGNSLQMKSLSDGRCMYLKLHIQPFEFCSMIAYFV
jgi:hypothetical protein